MNSLFFGFLNFNFLVNRVLQHLVRHHFFILVININAGRQSKQIGSFLQILVGNHLPVDGRRNLKPAPKQVVRAENGLFLLYFGFLLSLFSRLGLSFRLHSGFLGFSAAPPEHNRLGTGTAHCLIQIGKVDIRSLNRRLHGSPEK